MLIINDDSGGAALELPHVGRAPIVELDGEERISALTWFEVLAVLPLGHSADEVLDGNR